MKKKELTLQDIFNQNDELYRNIVDCFTKLEAKIDGSRIEDDGEVKSIEVHNGIMITDKDYVKLTEDGCFVGGEPAIQYNGEDIYRPYLCVAYFKEARDIIREEYGFELLELHCLQSSTEGEWAETGDPVPDKNGTCAWVRAVYKNKEGKTLASRWVFATPAGPRPLVPALARLWLLRPGRRSGARGVVWLGFAMMCPQSVVGRNALT